MSLITNPKVFGIGIPLILVGAIGAIFFFCAPGWGSAIGTGIACAAAVVISGAIMLFWPPPRKTSTITPPQLDETTNYATIALAVAVASCFICAIFQSFGWWGIAAVFASLGGVGRLTVWFDENTYAGTPGPEFYLPLAFEMSAIVGGFTFYFYQLPWVGVTVYIAFTLAQATSAAWCLEFKQERPVAG